MPGLLRGSWSFPSSLYLCNTPIPNPAHLRKPVVRCWCAILAPGSTTFNPSTERIATSPTPEFLNVIFLFCLHSLYDRNFCLLHLLHLHDFSLSLNSLSLSLEQHPIPPNGSAFEPLSSLSHFLPFLAFDVVNTSPEYAFRDFSPLWTKTRNVSSETVLQRERAKPHLESLVR